MRWISEREEIPMRVKSGTLSEYTSREQQVPLDRLAEESS